jgi:hypothetical protein
MSITHVLFVTDRSRKLKYELWPWIPGGFNQQIRARRIGAQCRVPSGSM